jgi:hypothetical protein
MAKYEKITTPKNEPVFELVNEQVVNKLCTSTGTSSGTGTEQALVSYINNTNIPNISNDLKIVNLDERAKNFQIEDNFLKIVDEEKKEKSYAKKEKEILVTSSVSSRVQSRELNPKIENVKSYFLEQHFPELEANKFFNYFSSIGWLVGGKSPMVDWKAAAQNWMLNANKFNPNEILPDRAKHLNTGTDKDYAEPL